MNHKYPYYLPTIEQLNRHQIVQDIEANLTMLSEKYSVEISDELMFICLDGALQVIIDEFISPFMERNVALNESDVTIKKRYLRTSLSPMVKTLQESLIVSLLIKTSKTIPKVAQEYNLSEQMVFKILIHFLEYLGTKGFPVEISREDFKFLHPLEDPSKAFVLITALVKDVRKFDEGIYIG